MKRDRPSGDKAAFCDLKKYSVFFVSSANWVNIQINDEGVEVEHLECRMCRLNVKQTRYELLHHQRKHKRLILYGIVKINVKFSKQDSINLAIIST